MEEAVCVLVPVAVAEAVGVTARVGVVVRLRVPVCVGVNERVDDAEVDAVQVRV